jgi:hypothetical protein
MKDSGNIDIKVGTGLFDGYDSVVNNIGFIFNSVMNWLKTLPWSTVIVGIVVPVASAYISYNLAESSIRRKESNRLNVYIEFVKKEINGNRLAFSELVNLKKEKDIIKTELEFPVFFAKDLLIDLLGNLSEIKTNYFRFDNKIFDKPNILYILSQKIEDIEKKIDEENFKVYDNELLRNERLVTLAKLEKEKEELLEELKNNSSRSIYNEFEAIYKKIHEATNNGKILEIDENSIALMATRKLYELLEEFVKTQNKSKEDVINLYDQIPLFSFDDNIVLNEEFDQEEFDLYYRHGFSAKYSDENPLFIVCENYYKLERLKNSILIYNLNWSNQKWQKYSDELVMINNKELYLKLSELVDNGFILSEKFMKCGIEEKERIIKEKFDDIIENIGIITAELQTKQEQIAKRI